MGSKALLVLVMFMATILLISTEVVPKNSDEKFDMNDDKFGTNGVEESKYYRGGGGFGGPWGGGYGGGYCRYGCCRWGYYGGCRRCCYYPGEYVEVEFDAEPRN